MATMRFDLTGGGGNGRGRRLTAAALSLGAHLILLPALFAASRGGPEPAFSAPPPILIELEPPPVPEPPPPAEPPPGPVADPAPPEGRPESAAAAAAPVERPRPARVPPPRPRPAVRPPPPEVLPLPAAPAPPAPTPAPVWATVGEAELAGALRAGAGQGVGAGAGGGGSGGGGGAGAGGACDMVGRLERALRGDPEVATAVARALSGSARGRALLVWNGDWVTSPGEAGKGLAGVRQAIAVEVAFAPAACRAEPVRGYAVVALAEGPGAPRLALGPGTWRWNELTGAR